MAEADRGAQPLLELRSVSFGRAYIPLISKLSLELSSGNALWIEGANGCGKTTLLRTIAGLSQSYDGHMLWRGDDIRQQSQVWRDVSLYLGHRSGVRQRLTVMENLKWQQALRHRQSSISIADCLAELGLAGYEHETCDRLSAGQLRRVALARLRLTPAEVWLLDEPFTALDRRGQQWLSDQICQHRQRGGLVLMTSHQVPEGLDELMRLNLEAFAA